MSLTTRRALRIGGTVVFALLLGLGVIGGGTLMAGHTYTLPHPAATDPVLAVAMHKLAKSARWTVVHVLYGRCQCSRLIIDAIASGLRPPDVTEMVVAVEPGADWATRLGRRGIPIVTTDQAALKRDYGVEAAPLLVVLDPSGQVVYSGGYTSRKQGPEIEDVAIVAAVRAQKVPKTLPVFGCATARELANALDPLGLK
jgi:hypothetical protein